MNRGLYSIYYVQGIVVGSGYKGTKNKTRVHDLNLYS